MLVKDNGYYDGRSIICNNNLDLKVGEHIIFYFEKRNIRKKDIDFNLYKNTNEKLLDIDATEYIRGERDADRF